MVISQQDIEKMLNDEMDIEKKKKKKIKKIVVDGKEYDLSQFDDLGGMHIDKMKD